jgi:hypothetical protein
VASVSRHQSVLADGCAWLAIVIGAITGVFATRLLRSPLFYVDSPDPIVLVPATVAILALALAASVIRARRPASLETHGGAANGVAPSLRLIGVTSHYLLLAPLSSTGNRPFRSLSVLAILRNAM